MRILIAILFLIFSFQVQAFFERGLSAAAGNNPAGANINASLAYNYKVWDKRSDSNDALFWNYGYLRPKISYESSVYINTFDAQLHIYPISLFGIIVGTQYSERAVKSLDLFDCDLANCKGNVRKNYYKLNLNLGYGSVIGALAYGKDFLEGSDNNTPSLVEYNSMLLFPQKTTVLENKVAFVGYKWSKNFTLALYESYYEIESKKSEGQYIVGNYKDGDFSWLVGVGTFGSDYNEKTFAGFVKVSWLLDPSLSLGN